jgi:hypothetical protein
MPQDSPQMSKVRAVIHGWRLSIHIAPNSRHRKENFVMVQMIRCGLGMPRQNPRKTRIFIPKIFEQRGLMKSTIINRRLRFKFQMRDHEI